MSVASGTGLHLVRPLGFVLSDRNLKRSGMDYWERLRVTVHDDDEAFFRWVEVACTTEVGKPQPARVWLFTSKGERSLWEADFADGDVLIFGSETRGISQSIRDRFPDRQLRIP